MAKEQNNSKKTSHKNTITVRDSQKKSNHGWIKLVRIIIYTISTISLTVGASLIKSSTLSSAYANGTAAIKNQVGQYIFYVSLIILCANIVWGTLRWFLRGSREGWRTGRIIGKLIGGSIWRTIVFIPLILVSFIFIAPKIESLLTTQQQDISPISLSEKYDRLRYINDNFETLKYDEIKDELSALMLSNIDFDVDASSNVSTKKSILSNNAYAYSSTVTVLNKAKLSDNGHFVVFYTDTGDDKISDEKASELAEMLEDIISGYKNNLGFEYTYEKLTNNILSVSKIKKVLGNSGIDEDILDSAMPVYIVDPYKDGSNTLATYAGQRFKDLGTSLLMKLGGLLGEETAKLYNSTPSYPFVNILPKNANSVDLPIVAAHELGHHYAAIYNEATYGKTGSDDNFVDETAPNWMAINVLPDQPQENLINRNHYNQVYLTYATGDTISKASVTRDFDGYPAVAFLENYYEIVPNSKTIIMDAIYYGDALNYLYEHAGEDNFRNVMMTLAEKNLTGDYNGKLTNITTPQGATLDCADICTRTFYNNPASTKYVYISTNEYLDTTIKFTGTTGKTEASLLGMTSIGDWQIIESRMPEIKYEINEEVAKNYETLVLATANYTTTDNDSYTVEVVRTTIADILAESGEYDFSDYVFTDFYHDLGSNCYEINTNAFFDNMTNLINLGNDFTRTLITLGEELEPGADFSEVKEEYEKSADKAKSSIEEAKNELSPYKITICGNYVKSGSSFDSVKSRLQGALSNTINITDEKIDGDRISVFVGFDLFTRTGKIYTLAQSDNEMGLITMNVEER